MNEDMSFESLDRTIASLTQQIELLSNKCKLEDNKKNTNFEYIIEASSLMLQLSRTLNELLVTRRFLKDSDGDANSFFNSIMHGRKMN